MKTCVFAGTFDPLTKGHEFVIRKCIELFDKVVVAVGVNVDKTPMFDLKARVEMIEKTFAHDKRVEVKSFNGMLVDFMKENDIAVNVRGIRDVDDYKYETNMERYNRDMYPQMTTLYIPTPKEMVHISSSAMRNILGLKGQVDEYVPQPVAKYIEDLK
jgi:pantetheine-phosphate adenylyltransferase